MARIRSIKIGFFTNEKLADLSPFHRLLFAGLWLVADKAGRLEDRPTKLKAELFPYDELDVNLMLTDLHDADLITRYRLRGASYIAIPTFLDHQHPHPKEPDSKIPAPVKSRGRPRPSREITLPNPAETLPASGEPGGLDLGLGDLDLGLGLGNGLGNGHGTSQAGQERRQLFARFWKAYPKKVGKGKAEPEFMKLRPTEDLLARMLSALEWQIRTPKWKEKRGEYIPHPATWLHQRRWEDEPFDATTADPNDAAWAEVESRLERQK